MTDAEGEEYERIEYTPYGELWVEKTSDSFDKIPFRFTGKELDDETGLYYYGARNLDPRTSTWLSADPALGDYIPVAPVDEEARKKNGNLPGMGGVYNLVNLHLYHYAGNNPIKYTDPTGLADVHEIDRAQKVVEHADTATSVAAGVLKQLAKPTARVSETGVVNGLPMQTAEGARAASKASVLGKIGKFFLPAALILGAVDAYKEGSDNNSLPKGLVRFAKNTAVTYAGFYTASLTTGVLESGAIAGTAGVATPVAVAGGVAAGMVAASVADNFLSKIERKIFE